MGKDFKEKYERVCTLKDRIISLVEGQLAGDLSSVDAKELGEVTDMAKDFAEIMKLCSEAEYYHKVTEAMDESDPEEKSAKLNKYIPEYEGKFYTPVMDMARMRDSRGRYMYTEPYDYEDDRYDRMHSNRMYYSSMNNSGSNGSSNMNMARDSREGRAYISRRGYMEANEQGNTDKKNKELEHYIQDLSDDITDMIETMDSNSKAILKQKITQLASKM